MSKRKCVVERKEATTTNKDFMDQLDSKGDEGSRFLDSSMPCVWLASTKSEIRHHCGNLNRLGLTMESVGCGADKPQHKNRTAAARCFCTETETWHVAPSRPKPQVHQTYYLACITWFGPPRRVGRPPQRVLFVPYSWSDWPIVKLQTCVSDDCVLNFRTLGLDGGRLDVCFLRECGIRFGGTKMSVRPPVHAAPRVVARGGHQKFPLGRRSWSGLDKGYSQLLSMGQYIRRII